MVNCPGVQKSPVISSAQRYSASDVVDLIKRRSIKNAAERRCAQTIQFETENNFAGESSAHADRRRDEVCDKRKTDRRTTEACEGHPGATGVTGHVPDVGSALPVHGAAAN
ncbi:hypothetical protein DPEC_G00223750 [Dallia pectoralis]|uniref:Uncharacterized protein n=1 Tax=Dallia pectoralis TaxID=75939 RepID=A0ACC2G037_DALPE|nr:hypothetical protein DPEC_G00223750 [Dallia pectoralis]